MTLLLLASLFAMPGAAQYQPQDAASSVQFKIKNFGFNTAGSFKGLSGRIQFDPSRVGEAAFDVSVDANTINTDNGMRDDHLRKESYFNVMHYPHIRLVSDRITASNRKGVFVFSGQLTIKNHSREITFPFIAEPAGGGYRFKGVFTINRKDFDVGGSSTIANEGEVTLDVLAK